MTGEDDIGGPAAGAAGDDQSKAGRVADTTMTEASNVASAATEGARDVASEAGAQAKAVASEAKQQLDRRATQGRDEVRLQAEQRSSQAAGQLRTLSEHFSALVEGRPGDAGPLVGYVNDVQHQLRQRGDSSGAGRPQGIVDDVTGSPPPSGLFLAGAASVGSSLAVLYAPALPAGTTTVSGQTIMSPPRLAPVGASQPHAGQPRPPGRIRSRHDSTGRPSASRPCCRHAASRRDGTVSASSTSSQHDRVDAGAVHDPATEPKRRRLHWASSCPR